MTTATLTTTTTLYKRGNLEFIQLIMEFIYDMSHILGTGY